MRYLFFLSLCLLACSSKPKNKNGYFEGEIKYKISYEIYNDTLKLEDLKYRYGTDVNYFFKEGNSRKDYYYSGELIQTRIYHPETNLNSMYYDGWDTIYQYTPHGKDFELVEYVNLPDTVIDGKTLEGVKVESKYKTKEVPNLIYTWYFDKKLKIDPAWFKENREGNWHQLMAEKKSLPYFYIIDDKTRFKTIFKTTKVEERNVSDSKFDLPDLPIQKVD